MSRLAGIGKGNHNGKAKDIVGNIFGDWIVLERLDNWKNRESMWLCRCKCGNEKRVSGHSLRLGRSKSCGCKKGQMPQGKSHPHWKGGRRIERGYVVLAGVDFPWKTKSGSTKVFEHVAVMSKHLGRPLMRGESVHHKNGIRGDNRIENLELWTRPQPSGCRVSDAVAWAKHILSLYEPKSLRNQHEQC